MSKIETQFNILKELKADSEWKSQNRENLVSQLFCNEKKQYKDTGFSVLYSKYIFQAVSQPAVVMGMIFVLIFGGSIFSLLASQNTKPGDSLYIAKRISEKTRASFTFDEIRQAKLGITFAGNRTREIAQVLADQNTEEVKKEKQAEELTESFKKEISEAKNKLANINIPTKLSQPEVSEDSKELDGENVDADEEVEVFSANLGKDEKGIQISSPDIDSKEEPSETQDIVVSENESATLPRADECEEALTHPTEALNQAEELFLAEDYDGALSILEGVNELIDQINEEAGEVKGEEESASSTVLGVEEEVQIEE